MKPSLLLVIVGNLLSDHMIDAYGVGVAVANSVKAITTVDCGVTWNVELNTAIASHADAITVGTLDIA